MRDLVGKGWSPEAAATVAGNVKAESDFNPGSVGDRGTSFGLVQWHGERARNLKKFAQSQGKDWRDWGTQVDFLDKEWRQRFGDKSVGSHDFNTLSRQGKTFEGYSTNTSGQRVGNARKFLGEYNAGGGKPPHFDVGDIRKRLAGGPNPAGAPQMTGDVMGDTRRTGGAFNDPSGTPIHGQRETVTLSNGQKVTVNARVAQQYKGFFNDLIDAGAPVHDLSGFGFRGGNPSQHPGGMAVDWSQRGRNVVSPDVQRWMNQNPAVLNELEKKWGMSGGEHWRNPDAGHFSVQNIWGKEHLEALARGTAIAGSNEHKAIRSMPNIGAAIGGTATQEQRKRDSFERYRQRADDYFRGHNDIAKGMIIPKDMREGLSPYDRLKAEEKAQEQRGLVTPGGPAEDPFKRSREQRASYDLLGHARDAGLVGAPLNHKVTGNASVDIRLANFPKGTVSKASGDGMFKQIKLSRGRAMPVASQES